MSLRGLVLIMAAAGCGGPAVAPLDIEVRIPSDPGLFADVETFALSVLDAEQQPLVLRRFDRTTRALRLDDVPFGPRLTFLLEGLVSTGTIVRGQSCPTDILSGRPYPAVSMLLSRVGSFSITEAPPAPVRRRPLTFVRSDGLVIAAGGTDEKDQGLASADSYDPRTGHWGRAAMLARARDQGDAASLPGGGALLAGGVDDRVAVDRIEIYQPDQGFRALPDWSEALGIGVRATALLDGRVLITGGAVSGEKAREDALLFEDGTVHDAGALEVGRRYHTVSVVGSGEFTAAFMIGGDGGAGEPTLTEIEVFNPRAAPARAFGGVIGHLLTARREHTATVLVTGDILVLGGRNEQGLPAQAETFDPITRTVLEAGRLAHPRTRHTATRLHDGRVLVTGGLGMDGQPLRSVEIFDPTIRNFVTARSLSVERSDHAGVELCDGTVLLVGGGPGAEIYNPAR
jgi:Kelch motif protein/galactose oxidase-like protein